MISTITRRLFARGHTEEACLHIGAGWHGIIGGWEGRSKESPGCRAAVNWRAVRDANCRLRIGCEVSTRR